MGIKLFLCSCWGLNSVRSGTSSESNQQSPGTWPEGQPRPSREGECSERDGLRIALTPFSIVTRRVATFSVVSGDGRYIIPSQCACQPLTLTHGKGPRRGIGCLVEKGPVGAVRGHPWQWRCDACGPGPLSHRFVARVVELVVCWTVLRAPARTRLAPMLPELVPTPRLRHGADQTAVNVADAG